MKCIINGKVLLRDRMAEGLAILFEEKIEKLVPVKDLNLSDYEVIDAGGKYVSPGLVDMHIHGYLGADVSDGEIAGIKTMAEGIIKNGVTAWCPTTMTVSKGEIEAAFDAVREIKNSGEYYGARILGVNSEGPFINAAKKGAQAEEHILRPDADFIQKHQDIVKLFTVAPEVDGAAECIEKVSDTTDVLISMGHTNATFEEAMAGVKKGVRHTTHLFNAMTALSHRSPGVVGAALSCDEVSTELIADTFHVSKGLFGLVAKIKGEKLCLITDCIRAGGMPDGDYTLGGQAVKVKGNLATLADGTIAGSVTNLMLCLKNAVQEMQIPLEAAVRSASETPARSIGIFDCCGSLSSGKRADIVLLDRDLNVRQVFVGGRAVE